MASWADVIGGAAAVCTTISYFPQIIKVFRDHDTAAISVQMYLILCTGLALWLAYGIMTASWPVIIGNGIALAFALIILIAKLRQG